MNEHWMTMVAATGIALLAAGCSMPGRTSTPPQRLYLLDDTGAIAPATVSRPCKTLRIATPRAAPGHNTRRMAYAAAGSDELHYFAWHRWADVPAVQFGVLAERRLESVAVAGHVFSGATDIDADLRLDIEQFAMIQYVSGPDGKVQVSAKLRLVDATTREILQNRRIETAARTARDSPGAGVAAAKSATTALLNALIVLVADGIATTTPCPINAR